MTGIGLGARSGFATRDFKEGLHSNPRIAAGVDITPRLGLTFIFIVTDYVIPLNLLAT